MTGEPIDLDVLLGLFDDPEADPLEDQNVRDGLGYRHNDHRPAPFTAGPNRRTVIS